ncbi:MAG TPA: DUF881 domain-containing protein [Nocardioides sp.]
MPPGSHASLSGDGPSAPRRRLRAWGWGTPLVLALSGGLFVTSALSSDGTDLRPGRYQDLAGLVSNEAAQAEALTERVNDLDREIQQLSEGLGDAQVDDLQAEVAGLRDPAGLTEHTGAGLTITLSDAPLSVRESSELNQNLHVVHQQDIQTVVNALWAGGAEAITIQGQRIITTTGIKCQGNAILLQGIAYPQPYVISAIGDPADLRDAIDDDSSIDTYREQADDPRIAVGWELAEDDDLVAGEYRGLLDVQHAEPLR